MNKQSTLTNSLRVLQMIQASLLLQLDDSHLHACYQYEKGEKQNKMRTDLHHVQIDPSMFLSRTVQGRMLDKHQLISKCPFGVDNRCIHFLQMLL